MALRHMLYKTLPLIASQWKHCGRWLSSWQGQCLAWFLKGNGTNLWSFGEGCKDGSGVESLQVAVVIKSRNFSNLTLVSCFAFPPLLNPASAVWHLPMRWVVIRVEEEQGIRGFYLHSSSGLSNTGAFQTLVLNPRDRFEGLHGESWWVLSKEAQRGPHWFISPPQ